MALTGDDILGIAFAVALGCLIASDDGAFAVKVKAEPAPAPVPTQVKAPSSKILPAYTQLRALGK